MPAPTQNPEILIPLPGHRASEWRVPYIERGLVDSEVFVGSLVEFNDGGGQLQMVDLEDGEVAVPRFMWNSLRRPPLGIRYEAADDGTGRMWVIDSQPKESQWVGDELPTGQEYPEGPRGPENTDPAIIQPNQPTVILVGPGNRDHAIEVHVGFTNVGQSLRRPETLAVQSLVVNTILVNTLSPDSA